MCFCLIIIAKGKELNVNINYDLNMQSYLLDRDSEGSAAEIVALGDFQIPQPTSTLTQSTATTEKRSR